MTALTLPRAVARRDRLARSSLLFATLVCAACGLVYELALIALGGFLVGNTVHQASVVLAVFVFAMGIGSLAAKGLQRRPVLAFAVIETLLAVAGGTSVLVLYVSFAWLDLYQPALVAMAFLLGALIGAEIPVLMTLLQRIREQAAGDAAADLFAADYIGALVGGLAFPFLLLPRFGQINGALVVGVLNVVAAAVVVTGVFGGNLGRVRRIGVLTGFGVVALALWAVAARADDIEVSARQALYEDPIVLSRQTPYQQIVMTRTFGVGQPADLRMFLNGDLQFSSVDEHRYHEALVHGAMAGRHDSVLVLGGGDGLALREVLRYRDVRSATLVELDPAMVDLARHHTALRDLNADALADERVEVVTADAFSWLRRPRRQYDVVIADFPDPDDAAVAKLYSVEMYGMIRSALAPGGRLVVQAGSPYFAPDAFWCIDASIRAAGLATTPFHVGVPSFGDWGYVLAAEEAPGAPLLADPEPPGLRFITSEVLGAATVFARDEVTRAVRPSTLIRPTILDYERKGWRTY